MDNTWQMKCSSTWQSLKPSMASSTPQLQPQEPRSQQTVSRVDYGSSFGRGRGLDLDWVRCRVGLSMSFWNLDNWMIWVVEQTVSRVDYGSSFGRGRGLDLDWVWNASLYFQPCVTNESSSASREIIREAMVPMTSNFCSNNSDHADPGSSFLSLLSGPSLLLQSDLHKFSSPKPSISSSKVPASINSFTVGAVGSAVSLACNRSFSQKLSSTNPTIGADICPVVSSRYGNSFSLLDVLQASTLKHHNSEPGKAVICHSDSSNEKVRDFSSLSRSFASAGKPYGTSTQASQKAPLEINSPISHCSSTVPSGCPRVFCLGASGNLLLSNTGPLGVVCLCHGLHMSISKFSEHSGLRDVNPGDAVRMDSGETIAQWRKIRVPEDHIGWDWPEGFSTKAGMMKHSVTESNVSKIPDPSSLAGSCGGLIGFRQPQNNVAFVKNPNTGQKLVNEVSCIGKQCNAQDSYNFLHKDLTGASQSNFHAVLNNQIMGCHVSGYSTMSKFVDSNSKSRQSFISSQNLHNSKSSGNDSNSSRLCNLKKGNTVDIESVSSGIELRLGQPSPQSQTLESSVLAAFSSHLFDTHGNSRAMEEHSQYLQHTTGSSNSCAKRGQSQLNHLNYAPGINNARDATVLDQLKVDADRSSVISMLHSQCKTPIDGRMHSKAAGGVIDGGHVMPRTLHCESHTAVNDPTSSPWSRRYATENQVNIMKLGLQKHVEKGKEVAFSADSLRVATEPNSEFHTRHIESSTNCNGVGGTGCHSCLVVHDKNSHLYQFSGMLADSFDPRNPFNHPGRIPCLGLNGHLDHGFLRSMSSPRESGSMLPLQAISVGFSAPTSTSVSNMPPALTTKEGSGLNPYLLDENLRVLAFRHIIELSSQGRAHASLGTAQEQERPNNTLHGSRANPSSSKEHRHGLAVTNKQVISDVAMKAPNSGFTCTGGDAENLPLGVGMHAAVIFIILLIFSLDL
ncbi:hypothetical protein U1Q18_018601 [Sarracenia purpurea var. burkii]